MIQNTIDRSDVELTKEDFVSDQMVRWCPGCGSYAILTAVANVFPKIGYKKKTFALCQVLAALHDSHIMLILMDSMEFTEELLPSLRELK